jgi:hypothetical protein
VCTIEKNNSEFIWDLCPSRPEQIKNWLLNKVYYSKGETVYFDDGSSYTNPDIYCVRTQGATEKLCKEIGKELILNEIVNTIKNKN